MISFSCSYIIIAVQSCGINSISFDPQLPQDGAFCNITKGCLAKFVVTYERVNAVFYEKS